MGVYSGGGLLAHDILMGFATKNDDVLGLNRASYEKIYVNTDLFVTSMAIDFRTFALLRATSDFRFDERPVDTLVRAFKGDLITRGYASVWYVVRGGSLSRKAFSWRFVPRQYS